MAVVSSYSPQMIPAELTISRSDGRAFSIGIDSDNTTGTWSLTDGSTTIRCDRSTTIDISANAQAEVDGLMSIDVHS